MKTFPAMLVLLLPALAAPAAPPPATAAPASDAASLLARVQQTYTKSPSFAMTFVQTYTPAGFTAASPETGRLTLQAPDLIRFDYDGQDGKVFTFDGTAARQLVARDKQLIVKKLAPEEKARLPLLFLESPETLLGRYAAAASPKDNGLFEIALTPREGGEPRSLALLVDGTGEVKRLDVVDSGDNRTTFTFTRRNAGRKLPATEFALVPPPGTKVLSE
jgi:outer membrane lipoprotein-sorting protein